MQIYGIHTATTLIPILGQLLSDGNTKLAAIYAPYFFIPLLLAIKMAASPEPFAPLPSAAARKRRAKMH